MTLVTLVTRNRTLENYSTILIRPLLLSLFGNPKQNIKNYVN